MNFSVQAWATPGLIRICGYNRLDVYTYQDALPRCVLINQHMVWEYVLKDTKRSYLLTTVIQPLPKKMKTGSQVSMSYRHTVPSFRDDADYTIITTWVPYSW